MREPGQTRKWESKAWAALKSTVEEAYEKHNGNRTRMAKELGVCLRTARKWCQELRLDGDKTPKRGS